jgi:DNA-binding MarR family transcriptional regulator
MTNGAGARGEGRGDSGDPAERIIADLRTGLAELRCVGAERLVRRGVSMGHLHLISMLDRHGELAMSRIADLLDVSLSNATGLIDRMAERGLVERARMPDDRRVVLVRVTPLGREILDEIEVLRNDVILKILAHLSPIQLERLAQAIDDLHGAIDAVRVAEPDLLNHDHASPGIHSRPHGQPTHSAGPVPTAASPEGRN